MSQVDQDGYEKAAQGEKEPLPPLNRLQVSTILQLIFVNALLPILCSPDQLRKTAH